MEKSKKVVTITATPKPQVAEKPMTEKPKPKLPTKVSSAATRVCSKIAITSSLKVAAKTTDMICAELRKKVLAHKNTKLPEISEVSGFNRSDTLKLIELLDTMGTATYNTACALRELTDKMRK